MSTKQVIKNNANLMSFALIKKHFKNMIAWLVLTKQHLDKKQTVKTNKKCFTCHLTFQ